MGERRHLDNRGAMCRWPHLSAQGATNCRAGHHFLRPFQGAPVLDRRELVSPLPRGSAYDTIGYSCTERPHQMRRKSNFQPSSRVTHLPEELTVNKIAKYIPLSTSGSSSINSLWHVIRRRRVFSPLTNLRISVPARMCLEYQAYLHRAHSSVMHAVSTHRSNSALSWSQRSSCSSRQLLPCLQVVAMTTSRPL